MPVVSFTYTPTGNRLSMSDASGPTSYTYDNQDRLKTKVTPAGTLSYTYDAVGNVASILSSNTNGVNTSYTWDELNRLKTVVDNRLPAGQNTTSYTYDPASNLATVLYPNGVQSSFSYDTLNRLTNLPITKSPTTIASYTYVPGPAGNRQSVTELSGRAVAYTYDGIYRLTNETVSGSYPNPNNGTIGYTLDPVGNRLSQTSTLSGIPPGSFTYDLNYRLSTESYDNNGNTIVSGARTFTYDFENRLKSMNNGAVTLQYDGDGNRVVKTVGSVTTKYLVDDLNPTGYAQVIEELVNGSVQRRYTYGTSRISQNQFINSTWTPTFYGYDGAGSVRMLTDATGIVTNTYDYDAWGNAVNVTGSTPNNCLYRGEQFDIDLGVYYLRARWYNPLSGRFLSRDTDPGHVSTPATLHKYLYTAADPVNRADPSGRFNIGEYLTAVGRSLLGQETLAVLQSFSGNWAVAGYVAQDILILCKVEILFELANGLIQLGTSQPLTPINPKIAAICGPIALLP